MVDLKSLLGTWAKPPDVVAWTALGAAAYVLFSAFSKASKPPFASGTAQVALPHSLPSSRSPAGPTGFQVEPARMRRRFLATLAFSAAFLSLGYMAHYLRGGPRIIDATTY